MMRREKYQEKERMEEFNGTIRESGMVKNRNRKRRKIIGKGRKAKEKRCLKI